MFPIVLMNCPSNLVITVPKYLVVYVGGLREYRSSRRSRETLTLELALHGLNSLHVQYILSTYSREHNSFHNTMLMVMSTAQHMPRMIQRCVRGTLAICESNMEVKAELNNHVAICIG